MKVFIAIYTWNYSDDFRASEIKKLSFDYNKVKEYCDMENEERIRRGDLNGEYEIEEFEID